MILLSKRIIDYDEKDLIKENQMSRQVIHTENALLPSAHIPKPF